jgi:hypothetical protein
MSEVQWLGAAVLAIIVVELIDVIIGIRRGKGKYNAKRSINRIAIPLYVTWGMSVVVLWIMATPFLLEMVNNNVARAGWEQGTLTWFVSHDLLPVVYLLTGAYIATRVILRPILRPLISYTSQEQQMVEEENQKAKARVQSFLTKLGVK